MSTEVSNALQDEHKPKKEGKKVGKLIKAWFVFVYAIRYNMFAMKKLFMVGNRRHLGCERGIGCAERQTICDLLD